MNTDTTPPQTPEFPAALIAHWPNQPFPCCVPHAAQIKTLGAAMGLTVSFTPAPPDSECINCVNEAKKAKEA